MNFSLFFCFLNRFDPLFPRFLILGLKIFPTISYLDLNLQFWPFNLLLRPYGVIVLSSFIQNSSRCNRSFFVFFGSLVSGIFSIGCIWKWERLHFPFPLKCSVIRANFLPLMSLRWLLLRKFNARFVSPTYWIKHRLHVIRYIILCDEHVKGCEEWLIIWYLTFVIVEIKTGV